MKDLFTIENVTCESLCDLLAINFGSKKLTMPYQLGFEVLNAILLAAKMAMCYEQVASKHWRELAKLEGWKDEVNTKYHRGFRRSTEVPNVKDCDVAFENQLVRLEVLPQKGNEILYVKFHFSDAFKIYRAGRIACREAKSWAGDCSKIWSGRAHLSTAEENDKLRVS